jgi:hypothetical protein
MVHLLGLPREILQEITSHLNLREKYRLSRTHRNALSDFQPGYLEGTYIWNKILRPDSPWLKAILSQGMYPVLIGRGLGVDESDVALVLARTGSDKATDSHAHLLLPSLLSESFSQENMAVYFSGFTLYVGHVLEDHIDIADPMRFLDKETNATRLVYWKGASTNIFSATAHVQRGAFGVKFVLISHTEGCEQNAWVLFKSTSERGGRILKIEAR